MTPELQELREALDGLRAGVLKKLAGLSEEGARRSTVDSGTNVAGLVQHLTFVEPMWFEQIVTGGRRRGAPGRCRWTRRPPSWIFERGTAPPVPPATRSFAALGDAEVPVTRDGRVHPLRWVMLAVIQETAGHAGQADIIREQIDGRTGR